MYILLTIRIQISKPILLDNLVDIMRPKSKHILNNKNAKKTTFPCPVRRVGVSNRNHFFGYYNKNIWSPCGRYILANSVLNMTDDLDPDSNLTAGVGMFDCEKKDEFSFFDATTTWNWQMGCQLQWLENGKDLQVIYNTRSSKDNLFYPEFSSTIHNIKTGKKIHLPLPIYVVAPNAKYALSIDYSRLQITHPTIGYFCSNPKSWLNNAPDHDGVHVMDLETGENNLIVSLRDLRYNLPTKSMDNAIHWVTHLEINPSSTRFLFIHRWTERIEDETCFLHRLYTVNPDGSDLYLLECSDHDLPQLERNFDTNMVGVFDYEKSEYQISHPTWRDDTHVMVWSPHNKVIHYHLYQDKTDNVSIIGKDILTENGHMTYSPDKKWLLTDTYPDSVTNNRDLILFNIKEEKNYIIGTFNAGSDLGKINRCDLHPRWNRQGTQVCIDSVHEMQRQLYIIDVESLIRKDI